MLGSVCLRGPIPKDPRRISRAGKTISMVYAELSRSQASRSAAVRVRGWWGPKVRV